MKTNDWTALLIAHSGYCARQCILRLGVLSVGPGKINSCLGEIFLRLDNFQNGGNPTALAPQIFTVNCSQEHSVQDDDDEQKCSRCNDIEVA